MSPYLVSRHSRLHHSLWVSAPGSDAAYERQLLPYLSHRVIVCVAPDFPMLHAYPVLFAAAVLAVASFVLLCKSFRVCLFFFFKLPEGVLDLPVGCRTVLFYLLYEIPVFLLYHAQDGLSRPNRVYCDRAPCYVKDLQQFWYRPHLICLLRDRDLCSHQAGRGIQGV